MSQPKPKAVLNKRSAARFAAVQALYQVELTGDSPQGVAEEFIHHRLGRLLEPLGLAVEEPAVDAAFFRRVLLGATEQRERLDVALSSALATGWSLERVGFLVRACLRAAAFELAGCTDVPVKVVINEYVELAKLFLADGEPGFINAVLDRLAPQLRSAEAVL